MNLTLPSDGGREDPLQGILGGSKQTLLSCPHECPHGGSLVGTLPTVAIKTQRSFAAASRFSLLDVSLGPYILSRATKLRESLCC